MLFKPVYIKSKMKEAPIPMARPRTPEKEPTPPPPPPEPQPQPQINRSEIQKTRLPILVCGDGVTAVFPKEATRDVLSGRVDYYLVDERGVTLFTRKHIFNALKLGKEKKEHLENYVCIGGHERILERRGHERKGLGYRRRYITPELIGRGIYGTNSSWSSSNNQRAMSSGNLYRGYTGPRA